MSSHGASGESDRENEHMENLTSVERYIWLSYKEDLGGDCNGQVHKELLLREGAFSSNEFKL